MPAEMLMGQGASSASPCKSTFACANPYMSAGCAVSRQLALDEAFRETLVSVDTFHSTVARWAVDAGAHIVNDVSGGTLDPDMHAEVRLVGCARACMRVCVCASGISTSAEKLHIY